MEPAFEHGNDVIVSDTGGQYVCRGTVVGVAFSSPHIYDVQPRGTKELTARLHVGEHQLRLASGAVEKMVKAYSKGII